jgi:hypothetical protein
VKAAARNDASMSDSICLYSITKTKINARVLEGREKLLGLLNNAAITWVHQSGQNFLDNTKWRRCRGVASCRGGDDEQIQPIMCNWLTLNIKHSIQNIGSLRLLRRVGRMRREHEAVRLSFDLQNHQLDAANHS